jgi:hypothetical protein
VRDGREANFEEATKVGSVKNMGRLGEFEISHISREGMRDIFDENMTMPQHDSPK